VFFLVLRRFLFLFFAFLPVSLHHCDDIVTCGATTLHCGCTCKKVCFPMRLLTTFFNAARAHW